MEVEEAAEQKQGPLFLHLPQELSQGKVTYNGELEYREMPLVQGTFEGGLMAMVEALRDHPLVMVTWLVKWLELDKLSLDRLRAGF